jgi:ketosteroid isomerase-like protein
MKLFTATAAALLLMASMAFAQDTGMAAKSEAMASKADMHMGSNVEQQLKDMENQWAKASLSSNGEALMPMLSEDFVNIDSDGTVHNKAQTIARTAKAKFQVSEISDMQVNEHGDSAIVTGTWTGKGVDGTGKAIDARERWADTWVKKDGKWQCVASASAPMMMK